MDLHEQYLDFLSSSQIRSILIMNKESFDNLINYNNSTSFFLFTITCFSFLIYCMYKDKYTYQLINQDSRISSEVSV